MNNGRKFTSLMGIAVTLALPLVPLEAGTPIRKTFSLQGAELSITAPEGARIEALESGGYRVAYSNEAMREKRQMLEIKKTFTPSRDGESAVFDVTPADGAVAFHVWSQDGKSAYKNVTKEKSGFIDISTLHFKNSKDPFSGPVKAIALSVEIDGGSGEHVVEISKFDLE